MTEVLVAIETAKWIAKDAHYRSRDEWFYALHLLADKLDFGNAEDDLKEAYYLGAHEILPPTEGEIHKIAADKIGDTSLKTNKELIEALREACEDGLYQIEAAKRESGLYAGVHAILDGISQKLLVVKGLCWRTLTDGGRSK